jgi:hypothetical protein
LKTTQNVNPKLNPKLQIVFISVVSEISGKAFAFPLTLVALKVSKMFKG